MKRIFVTVLIAAVAAVAGFGIYYVMSPVDTQRLEYITQENSINTNGFIIRDEWVMYTRSAGTVYHSASEGERVAKDSVIGALFYGDVGEDSIKELAVVDSKIKNARADTKADTETELDGTGVENNIYKRENMIVEAAENNDISAVSQYKNDINSLRQNGTLSGVSELSDLEAQREQIIANIGVAKEDITANISGVFTTYEDGYETLLTPADIENYDVAYFESLSQSPKAEKIGGKAEAGGAICKIVNNHVWYVIMDVSKDTLSEREEGDDVKMRFNNMADTVVDGTIYHISEEQNGRNVVTVKCSTYVENALSYRLADVDLIFESYDGYKVPVHAIHTDADGKQKVIGVSNGRQYDCYCDLLFTNTDSGYTIVQSTDDAANKLSQMERIVVGER